MGKKREAATGSTESRNERAPGGVSPVRGTDQSAIVTHLPGVSGLPGVRSGDPNRNAQEVPTSPAPVAKGTVKPVEQMSLDEKLALLNAFKKIRNTPPKVGNSEAKKLINDLYTAWIDETMIRILNLSSATAVSSGLTGAEIDVLKVLAQTILQRRSSQPSTPAQAASPPMMGANPAPQNAAPMVPRTGLNPGVNSDAYRSAQAQFLSELSKMDREGPDFNG